MSDSLQSNNRPLTANELSNMTKSMIMAAAPEIAFGRADKRNKKHLLETVAELPLEVQNRIRQVANVDLVGRVHERDTRSDTLPVEVDMMDVEEETLNIGDFLKTASQATVEDCISNFVDSTCNAVVNPHVCMVCAREIWAREVERWYVKDIPNKNVLRPAVHHPAHVLTEGMLLEREVLEGNGDEAYGDVCHDCVRSIKKKKTPPLSLANGMWVGPIPHVLSVLSLPERILIGRYFPAAFIVKLFPKQKGAKHWPTEGLNSGVRGNVSTYKLNTEDIVDMVEVDVMPPSPSILASTIGVSIIGPKNLPERTMSGFLRVRRERIRLALIWLKQHNPLYSKITISETRLNELPVNGVPQEILGSLRHSDNVDLLEKERAGCAFEDDDFPPDAVEATASGLKLVEGDMDEDEEGYGPDVDSEVVPLQSLGVIDVGGSDVAEKDVLAHALANVSQSELKTAYAVRRGSQFVNEYPRLNPDGKRSDGGPEDPNHLLGAFPLLYPYAQGGIEVQRPIQVSYAEHARWALQYRDRRFRKDLHFVFEVFGVLQKRQVCNSASLQIKRKDFLKNEKAIRSLKPDDLIKAASEESRRIPFTNTAVQSFRKHLTAVRAKVMGTDESRVSIRSKIWSLTAQIGPPSLWITINPSDVGDPIAQVLAGVDIDLDKFDRILGPDASARSSTIVGDPYAAAKFFHFIIDTVLRELFGIQAATNNRHIAKKTGIFGHMSSYIGAVEAQGRGTLHFHVVCWMKDAPSSIHMKELLKGDMFRRHVSTFIKANIRSDIRGADASNMRDLERQNAVSYSRPEDPREDGYLIRSRKAEEILARSVQVHSCSKSTCLQLIKGRLRCKRNAPFELSERDWIDEDGSWGSKRHYAFLNAWSPPIMQTVRANQDIKMITNGEDTKNIAWYISKYVAKKQTEYSNCSALLAKRIAFHNVQERYNPDTTKRNKRLLQRCANTLSREQVFSAPEASSYVMGWTDRKIAHHFVTMFTGELYTALKNAYPTLRYSRRETGAIDGSINNEKDLVCREPPQEDDSITITMVDGQLQPSSQLKDYINRGILLENFCLLDFIRDTYDGTKLETASASSMDGNVNQSRGSVRSDYINDDGKGTRCRVLRRAGHETKVEFVGKWIPRRDNKESHMIYCGMMLALLVPWRTLASVHGSSMTLEEEFDKFTSSASAEQIKFMHDVQYYYESSDSAQKKRLENDDNRPRCIVEVEEMIIDDENEHGISYEYESDDDIENQPVSEDQIEDAILNRFSVADQVFAETAMAIAEDLGVFVDGDVSFENRGPLEEFRRYATVEDTEKFRGWENVVISIGEHDSEESLPNTSADIDPRRFTVGMDVDARVDAMEDETVEDLSYLKALNVEQRKAHDIIINHLDAHLKSKNPRQMLMIVVGSGGTGKSTMLNAITTSFTYRNSTQLLAKTAMSGVAASLIGGSTLHMWGGLPVKRLPDGNDWMNRSRKDIRTRREKNVGEPLWLAVDEMGMLTKDIMTYLSQVAGIVRTGDGHADSTIAIGGLNVLLTGDFHQFPPVANVNASLYSSLNPRPNCLIGENIFNQFETVIELVEQMRITDSGWLEILQNARTGDCTPDNLAEIRRLVLTNPECDIPDFSVVPWNDAILVTPRNCVRTMWNYAKLQEHCIRSSHLLYVVDAEDTIGRERRTLTPKERLTVAGMDIEATQKIENRIYLAIGMKVMVTRNIATDIGLANGSRGSIIDIVLDGRETAGPNDITDGIVHLAYPPAMVVVKPSNSPPFETFVGLRAGEVPMFPTELKFDIGNKKEKIKITRRQFNLTAAYAFTDHKAQGQTLEYVIVDIGKLKTFPVNQFAAYVALSRSRGRQTIRLLRDFDDRLFTIHPSEDLKEQDERLKVLSQQTEINWQNGFYKF